MFTNTFDIAPTFDNAKVAPVNVYVKPGFVAMNCCTEEEVPENGAGSWKLSVL